MLEFLVATLFVLVFRFVIHALVMLALVRTCARQAEQIDKSAKRVIYATSAFGSLAVAIFVMGKIHHQHIRNLTVRERELMRAARGARAAREVNAHDDALRSLGERATSP